MEAITSNVAIVYHSGFGHTQALAEAEAVATGTRAVPGTSVSLIRIAEAEVRAADSTAPIVFGGPTYMGGVLADFARFKDWTSSRWMEGRWCNKLAAGFTVSASWNGDKHNTLYQLLTLVIQHGMVWIGRGLRPGNKTSKGPGADLNRVGSSIGAMAQANADHGVEGIGASDFKTFEALGRRVAEATERWREEPVAEAA